MGIIDITKENFAEEVLNSDKPVLLDFNAQWCGPCHMVSPVLDEISKERDDLKIGKIDVDQQQELAQQFKVMSIPMLVAVKQGEVKKILVGVQGKQALLDMMDE